MIENMLPQLIAHGFEKKNGEQRFAASKGLLAVASNNLPNVRPSLNMDFVNGRTLDPRATFARTSFASSVNEQGYITWQPSNTPRFDFNPVTLECRGLLIEDTRTNLFPYSNHIDLCIPGPTGGFYTPYVSTSPDGSLSATRITGLNGGSRPYTARTTGALTIGSVYCLSCYAKNVSLTNLENVYFKTDTDAGGVSFNLVTKVAVPTGVFYNALMTDEGNGWFRLSALFIPLTSTQFITFASVLTNTPNSYDTWGGQLELGSFPSSVIMSPTVWTGRTTSGSYINRSGVLVIAPAGSARYNSNPNNLKVEPVLLLEKASRNFCTYSEQLNAVDWIKNAVVTANTFLAPDGNLTADTVDISGPTQGIWQILTVTPGTVYTMSFYAAAGTQSLSFLTCAFYNETIGSFVSSDIVPTIIETNSKMTRFAVSVTVPVGCLSMRFYPIRVSTVGTFYFWGGQIETSLYATSYITTLATSVLREADTHSSGTLTRAADSVYMTGSNFSSWFNPSEYTLFASCSVSNYRKTAVQYVSNILTVVDSLNLNYTMLRFFINTTNLEFDSYQQSSGVNTTDFAGGYHNLPNEIVNIAVSTANNNSIYCKNGTATQTDTSCSVPVNLDRLKIISENMHLRQIDVYSKALTAANLQAITS